MIDLRDADARTRAPSRLAQFGIREPHLPIEPRAMGALRELREAGGPDKSALAAIMFEVYRRFVNEHTPVFASLLRLVADEATPLPLVVHCTAGKDRTGWALALLLLALGVPRETVLDDFMASNGRWSMQGVSADWALRATVHADYLQCAFDEIDKRWGSKHAYLEGPVLPQAQSLPGRRARGPRAEVAAARERATELRASPGPNRPACAWPRAVPS